MTTIERNYRKNPHTASFLQTFHSGISSKGRNYRAELATVTETVDPLDLVPTEVVQDLRSPAQVELMDRLIGQISGLDLATGEAARAWTDKATASGVYWTPGYQGTASAWISRMLDKVRELRAAQPTGTTADAPKIADGRYAVEEDGVLKFFRVKNGNRSGFVFLDVQASDDWHAIRNVTRIHTIVALIARDPKGAMARYGQELGICGDCGRTLTDETSRAIGIGPICRTK